MSHERGLDDHHRQQLAIGAVTLAEAIHNVGDLLVRLADLLVPDFADLMVAADVATGTTTPALVRPDGDEARKLLDWVAPLYGGLVERWLAPRLYATGLGLSVIVVPVLEGGGGRSRHVLALGRRADVASFDSDDLAFIEQVMREVGSRADLPMPAPTNEMVDPVDATEPAETTVWRARRLQRLTAQLSEALNPAQVAEVTAHHAMASLGASAAWVGLVDAHRGNVQLACAPGLSREFRERFASSSMQEASPLAAAARLDGPRWLATEQEILDAYPELGQVQRGLGSLAVLPLAAGARPLGGIGLCRERAKDFSADERGEVLALCTLGTQALERAVQFEIAQHVAATLSLSLLPRVPEVPGITIYSRYLPAATDARVGGDWYDVIPLSSGRVGLVVGDVAGHGVRAAAEMGQLRTGLRAYLREGHDPAEALGLTDVLTSEMSPTLMTTVWCGILDPETGRLSYANAGHPPPAVLDLTGEVSFLDREQNPPLGIRWGGPFAQADAQIEPAAFLVCYTDGLIERPGERFDSGLERLSSALRPSVSGLDELGDRLLALPVETHIDDVALLAIYRDPPDGGEGPVAR